ncbi:hypothetical protein L7F22_033288 [Adiantum nelumboides]|nr:hypothetical protein [Adiantum nelumboides]
MAQLMDYDTETVEAWETQLRHSLSRGRSISSRNSSFNKWTSVGADNVLTLASHSQKEAKAEDDEALKWAALERLPTFYRLRTSVRKKCEDGKMVAEHVDVRKMDLGERQLLMERLVKDAEQDNGMFLQRLRNRIDKYCHLDHPLEADRQLPSLIKTALMLGSAPI